MGKSNQEESKSGKREVERGTKGRVETKGELGICERMENRRRKTKDCGRNSRLEVSCPTRIMDYCQNENVVDCGRESYLCTKKNFSAVGCWRTWREKGKAEMGRLKEEA